MTAKIKRLSRQGVLLLLLTSIVILTQTATTKIAQGSSISPPFQGTIFLDRDIVTPTDPTTFERVTSAGRGSRTVFDRRVNNWITINAYLFDVVFSDGLTTEAQVNPEFGNASAAMAQAEKYGRFIGQLPHVLRTDVKAIWIHKGTQPFGGGNDSILIHTGQSDLYTKDGILEETLVHEASHTSLDATHASAPGWKAAQAADGNFISTYANDNPNREDIAESFLLYLAVRFRADRISQSLKKTIEQTIPNRLAYFDEQGFDMRPIDLSKTDDPDSDGDGVLDKDDLCPNFPGSKIADGC